ncbi:MAG TPA: PD-(D/E)XK nuclease family protein [Actinopolymorphaceae bacterium]
MGARPPQTHQDHGAPAEQLGFDDMPRRLFRATPTRLLGWLDCPRRYRFTYLERPTPPKGPPWAHNSLGASVHTALAAWWRLPIDDRTPEAAGRILQQVWIDEGFRDSAQSMRWRSRARELVEQYVATLDPAQEPVGVERTVALTTSSLALSGRIDRIDERAGETGQGIELVVVDYKTGHRTLTTADARSSLALAVYAAATARTLRKPCRRVELHHLPTGSVVAWEHTDESLSRHLARADEIGIEAADAEEAYARGLSSAEVERVFPPMPGPQCQWCDFAGVCPDGRAAYPTRRPWEGLPPE